MPWPEIDRKRSTLAGARHRVTVVPLASRVAGQFQPSSVGINFFFEWSSFFIFAVWPY